MKELRQHNGYMEQEKKQRERQIKQLNYSQERETTEAPKNINLISVTDDSRVLIRRKNAESLKRENKGLKLEKEHYKEYQYKQKGEELK